MKKESREIRQMRLKQGEKHRSEATSFIFISAFSFLNFDLLEKFLLDFWTHFVRVLLPGGRVLKAKEINTIGSTSVLLASESILCA